MIFASGRRLYLDRGSLNLEQRRIHMSIDSTFPIDRLHVRALDAQRAGQSELHAATSPAFDSDDFHKPCVLL